MTADGHPTQCSYRHEVDEWQPTAPSLKLTLLAEWQFCSGCCRWCRSPWVHGLGHTAVIHAPVTSLTQSPTSKCCWPGPIRR